MKTRLLVSVSLAGLLAACGPPRVLFGGTHGASARETSSAHLREDDLRPIARKLMHALANAPRFAQPGPRLPVVRVGRLENKTSEPLDMAALGDELQRALSETGRFVLSAADAPEPGAGADYLLTGELTSLVQQAGSDTLIQYRLTATLHDVRTGRVAWRDEREIRRKFENLPVTW